MGFSNGDTPIPPPPPDVLAPPPPPSSSAPPPPAELPPPPPSDALPPPPEDPAKRKKAGWGAPRDRGPLSIEDILKKKKEADEAAAKVRYPSRSSSYETDVHKARLVSTSTHTDFLTSQPKFLSKAAREKLALEKREKEVEEQKRKLEAERNGIMPNSNGHVAPTGRDTSDRSAQRETNGRGSSSVPTGPRAMRPPDPPAGPAAVRNRESNRSGGDTGAPTKQLTSSGKASLAGEKRPANGEDTQAALIRTRYMGADTNQSTFSAKKKRRRTTEKKFNFEWNAEEDTSPDYNPIYSTRAEANFFGRGRLGGFAEDLSETGAAKYAKALEERDTEAGGARAREIMEMERRRKEDAGGRNSRQALEREET